MTHPHIPAPTVSLGTRVSAELAIAVRAAAAEEGTSVAVFLRMAVESNEQVQAHLVPAEPSRRNGGTKSGKLRIKGGARAT